MTTSAPAGSRLERAERRAGHLRRLRLVAGRRRRRRLLAGPRLERAGDRPRERRTCSGRSATKSPSHGPNGVAVAEGKVFGATPTAAFALDQASGKELWSTNLTEEPKEAIDMAPGVHDGLVYISNRAGRPPPKRTTPAASPGRSGRSTRRPARNSGTSTPSPKGLWWRSTDDQRRRRPLVPALLRRRRRDVLRDRQPGAVPGRPRTALGLEPARARTSTPTRWSSSTPKTGKLDWHYQADAARPLRLGLPGLADPGAGGRQGAGDRRRQVRLRGRGRRQDRQAGLEDARSANTTATTTTACWRCAAKTSKIKTGEVYPGSLGGVIAPMAANEDDRCSCRSSTTR